MILFDRWGTQLGTVSGIAEAKWSEVLNGEDAVSVKASYPLAKGNRIVWRDTHGEWHEHAIASVVQTHDGGRVTYSAECENSISELYGDFIGDKRPENATASAALSVALEPTRWDVGTVTVPGTKSTNFYRENCRKSVQKIIETWGGELSTSISISGCEVASRKVNITRRGSDNGRRFEYGSGMTGIKRTFIADDVCTAMFGYGKGEEVGNGYGRGIDFADINDGKEYVESAEALETWGRPDGNGGKAHVFGKAEFSDCDNKAELLELTRAELANRCVPKVSYEASVSVFAENGFGFSDVAIGDDVALIDRTFSPEIRVKGRVTKIVRDMLDDDRPTDVTIGNIVESAADMVADQYAELQSLSSRATGWDVAAYTPSAYINQLIDGLNKEFDAGASYIYQSPEQGIIVGSVPLDPDTGEPTRSPASAIQLKGGGFRIANSLKSDGSWNWRTFGTGDGFTADVLNAGAIKGGNSYWNLETGDLQIKDGTISIEAKIDGKIITAEISPKNGFRLMQGSTVIGGVAVVNDRVVLRANVAGSSTNYIDISPDDGTVGMRFFVNGEPVFQIKRGGRLSGGSNIPGTWIGNPKANSLNILLQDNGSTYINHQVTD